MSGEPARKRVQVNLEVDGELHKRLKLRAVEREVSLADLCEALLEVGLKWDGEKGSGR